jgi:N-glycosylase/DNA lyase
MVKSSFRVPGLSRELVLDNTFFIGQVFNWVKTDAGVYCGTYKDKLLEIRVESEDVYWELTPAGTESEVRDYLNLDVKLSDLYRTWTKDSFFNSVYKSQPGVRILSQPIFECLISFICSQNCHVTRIAKNLQTLKTNYGKKICYKHGKTWYSFPTVDQLEKASEDVLNTLGLGYRSKYIKKTVEKIQKNGGELWLDSLTQKPTEEIKQELVKLDGIGPKVADCILLFGFNRFTVVPIDTHMWKLAINYYNAPKTKSLTNKLYTNLSKNFEKIFGDYAGWAHSILYAASLKKELPKRKNKK